MRNIYFKTPYLFLGYVPTISQPRKEQCCSTEDTEHNITDFGLLKFLFLATSKDRRKFAVEAQGIDLNPEHFALEIATVMSQVFQQQRRRSQDFSGKKKYN